ncbi:hypothetical protein [Desulfosporosinus metallidurans]|uniref:Zinc ribbon domain-containing protein n=1 Tax=Desulfosporosinus metallidurans TaxID=1888891 RepID=A0A1Q8QWJ9_9FIRM|nr:hypothetical protein [Desulfosporosinus metallidurans]OLN31727.1 hypothetical protein DSOL_2415 [Desulfosporosinus metallidurans]
MICKNCGKEIVGKGVFCKDCGERQDASNMTQSTDEDSLGAAQTPPAIQEQCKHPEIQNPTQPLSAQTTQKGGKPDKSGKPSKKIILLVAIILVAITSIGIAISILVSSHNSKKPMSYLNDWNIVIDAQRPDYSGFVKLYYEQVTFVIEEQVLNDDGIGTAKVTVTTPNMRIILEKVLSSLSVRGSLSDEELAEQAKNRIELLLKQDSEKITTTIEVPLKRIDGKWKIVPNKEWTNVITSNMAEILREYYAKIIKEDLK